MFHLCPVYSMLPSLLHVYRSVPSQLSFDTSTVSTGLANKVIARTAPVAAVSC